MLRVSEIRRRTTIRDAGPRAVVADLLSSIWNLGCAFCDFVRVRLPLRSRAAAFAFLIHPPAEHHIFTPWPFLRYLPQHLSLRIARRLPPCRPGQLRVRRGGKVLAQGDLLAVMVAPEHLLADGRPHRVTRAQAVDGVRTAVELARRRGAKVVGMGAYLPPLTRHGLLLTEDGRFSDLCLTTGHACTAYVIAEMVGSLRERLGVDPTRETVAIVGGAGSTGSALARVLARERGIGKLLLIDLPRKAERLHRLASECRARCATDLSIIREAGVIITLTTAPGSIMFPEHIGESTIVIDDSKPRNTDEHTLGPLIEQGRLIVLDVLAEVPGLEVTFHYDLDPARPEVTYTCLAEVFALALSDWRGGHFSIGEVPVERVRELARMARRLGIRPAPYTSFNRPLTEADLSRFSSHRQRSLEKTSQ